MNEASDFKFGTQLGLAEAHHQIPFKMGVALNSGSSPKFGASPLIFLQQLKLATSYLANSLRLPRPIIIHTQRKIWRWPWAREAPQSYGFPYNISATVGVSDFKFDARLGFAEAHHKIPHRRKSGRARVL